PYLAESHNYPYDEGILTAGYALLGALIEQASDQSYGSYIEDHIFNPLGMVNTKLDDPQEIIPLRASCYEIDTNEKLINSYNTFTPPMPMLLEESSPQLRIYICGTKPCTPTSCSLSILLIICSHLI
ncbi:serine hydrolase, partial [Clostridium perfringens]